MKRTKHLPGGNTLLAVVMAACGATVGWIAFYPGFMSFDSLVQYKMARWFVFNDWHPPIMSWLWSVLLVFPGPSGMLAFHLGLLWSAIFIWWKSYRDERLSWLLFFIPFCPWIVNFQGVLWKDVGMAFSLFLLSSLSRLRPSTGKYAIAAALVFYAINVRHNAVFAALPVIFFLAWTWLPRPNLRKAALIAVALVALSIFGGNVLNYGLLNAEKAKPYNYIIIDDLGYISVKNNESFLPEVGLGAIRACATDEGGETKLVGKVVCLYKFPDQVPTDLLQRDLTRAWLSTISRHPFDYIEYRLAAFSYFLRTPDDEPYYIWHDGIDSNDLGVTRTSNIVSSGVNRLVDTSARMAPFLFKPYWWLLVTTVALILSLALTGTAAIRSAQMMLSSSFLYIMSFLPAVQMADFRYVYWSVIATSIALLSLLIDRPTVRKDIPLSAHVCLLSLALSCSVFIYGFGRLTGIDMDTVVENAAQTDKRLDE
ncbi:MAG: hypothetical protein LBB76_03495 [Azoarcus sp.]|nr:hypothetical protein [Azoarcus sp.]